MTTYFRAFLLIEKHVVLYKRNCEDI